jgi:hypothetical protein
MRDNSINPYEVYKRCFDVNARLAWRIPICESMLVSTLPKTEEELNMVIADRLRGLREQKNLSQGDKFRRLMKRADERDRKLLLFMAQKWPVQVIVGQRLSKSNLNGADPWDLFGPVRVQGGDYAVCGARLRRIGTITGRAFVISLSLNPSNRK